MRECEEMLKFVQSSRNLQLGLAAGKPPNDAHEWSMQRRWTVMPVGALQDKKSSLAILFAHGLNSWLNQVARPSRQPALFWKTWLFAFHSHSHINTPHTHEILRASRENIERETLEKNKIDSSKFLYSHPFHCYILERFITKTFSHHTHICEKAIWCLGSS